MSSLFVSLAFTCALVISAYTAAAQIAPQHSSNPEFTVDTVATIGYVDGGYAVKIQYHHADSAEPLSVTIVNRIHTVTDYFLTAPTLLSIRGTLLHGGDIVVMVDLRSREVVDAFWAYDLVISPDHSTAVYRYRIPPHGMRAGFTTTIVGYDLRRPSSAVPGEKDTPADRGVILYPEQIRNTQQYFTPELTPSKQLYLRSPIVFCETGTQVGFVIHQGDVSQIVRVDLTEGIERSKAYSLDLPVEPFIADSAALLGPIDEKRRWGVAVERLAFSSDCSKMAVKSLHVGILAPREFVFDLATGEMVP